MLTLSIYVGCLGKMNITTGESNGAEMPLFFDITVKKLVNNLEGIKLTRTFTM